MYFQENHNFERDVFFDSSGPVVQVPCPSGHTVTGRFYKNSVLKKVKEFYNKKRPSKGWSGVHLLHDNASSRKREVVRSFLPSEKMKKKKVRIVQGVPQWQTALLLRRQEEEKTDKSKQAQIEQTYEKH